MKYFFISRPDFGTKEKSLQLALSKDLVEAYFSQGNFPIVGYFEHHMLPEAQPGYVHIP
jgi:hypothetical protein